MTHLSRTISFSLACLISFAIFIFVPVAIAGPFYLFYLFPFVDSWPIYLLALIAVSLFGNYLESHLLQSFLSLTLIFPLLFIAFDSLFHGNFSKLNPENHPFLFSAPFFASLLTFSIYFLMIKIAKCETTEKSH